MAYTLTSTLSNEFSNSYVDLAYADNYWANHYSTVKSDSWSALGDDPKTLLLILACRTIESMRFTYTNPLQTDYQLVYDQRLGVVLDLEIDPDPMKFAYNQALQFPRNLDRNTTTGMAFIPEGIQMAQCEQAVYTLNFDESVIANRLQGITRDQVTVGNISLRQAYDRVGTSVAPAALEMVRPFLVRDSRKMRRG